MASVVKLSNIVIVKSGKVYSLEKEQTKLDEDDYLYDNKVWYVGAQYAVGHVGLSAMYLKGDLSNDHGYKCDEDWEKDGYVIGLDYKGAKAAEVGSWGLWAKYYNQGVATYLAHTTDANTFKGVGFKGYGVGANYTFAKNIVGQVEWYDLDQKEGNKDAQTLWSQVVFTF